MNSRGVEFYSEQLSQLTSELGTERSKLSPEETESLTVGRLNQTEQCLHDAGFHRKKVLEGVTEAGPELHRALISAQVELDYLRNPDIDPIVGWIDAFVEKRAGSQEYAVVDSQLFRAYLDRQTASLVSFQYKPRKIDLTAGVWELSGILSFTQQLFDPSPKEPLSAAVAARLITSAGFEAPSKDPKCETTIKTKDLIRIRQSSSISRDTAIEYRDFIFKAGVGAHLANATTGFSVEHWLESKGTLQTQLQCLQMNLGLPTKDINLISSKALTAFGGVSEKVKHLSSGLFLKSSDEPAGVHGVRLIDGLGSLVIDVRSAKPLNALCITPQYDRPTENGDDAQVVGLVLQFFIDARRILADDKANTVFVSIT